MQIAKVKLKRGSVPGRGPHRGGGWMRELSWPRRREKFASSRFQFAAFEEHRCAGRTKHTHAGRLRGDGKVIEIDVVAAGSIVKLHLCNGEVCEKKRCRRM